MTKPNISAYFHRFHIFWHSVWLLLYDTVKMQDIFLDKTASSVCLCSCVLSNLSSIKFLKMNILFYAIAAMFVIGWILSVFLFALGGIVHILLVLAIISILLQMVRTTEKHHQ